MNCGPNIIMCVFLSFFPHAMFPNVKSAFITFFSFIYRMGFLGGVMLKILFTGYCLTVPVIISVDTIGVPLSHIV